jgi:arsenite methyltransferase
MVSWRAGGARGFDLPHLDRIYNTTTVRLQRARTRQLLDVRAGDLVLDLGCGAGHLTTDLAGEVSPAGLVVGLDQQASMVAGAAARVAEDGVADNCAFARADACSLPLKDKACHRLAAVQVLEYVADVAGALAEVHRVLAVGGRAVLVDTDWRSCVWHTNDRERTDAVLRAWESHFLHPHLPAQLPRLAQSVGFETVEVHALPIVETHEQTDMYSLGMAATIERFVERRAPGLADGWREDVRSQTRRGTYFFSLTRFAVVLTR